jgi:hypothetical protein
LKPGKNAVHYHENLALLVIALFGVMKDTGLKNITMAGGMSGLMLVFVRCHGAADEG